MDVKLAPEDADMVRLQVRKGKFHDPEAVVAYALRVLREIESEREALRRKIDEGYESALRGEVRDGADVFEDLERKIRRFEGSHESG